MAPNARYLPPVPPPAPGLLREGNRGNEKGNSQQSLRMKRPWTRRLLRISAFLPALVLGIWLVDYTQRQAARPETIKDLISEAAEVHSDPFPIDLNLAPEVIDWDGFVPSSTPVSPDETTVPAPHVIRVTSKRIEMPIFNTREITKQPTPWLGDTVTAAPDRKGIEPWLADFIDRLTRNIGGESSATP